MQKEISERHIEGTLSYIGASDSSNINPNINSNIKNVFLSFLRFMKEKHNMSLQELISLYNESTSRDNVPVVVFSFPISPAEALCKYLKENIGLNFHEIGELINRDERGVWGSYHRAVKKMAAKFSFSSDALCVPVSLFHERSLSILEHVVHYLSFELKMKNKDIAKLLNKKQAVVHTTLQRALGKGGEKG